MYELERENLKKGYEKATYETKNLIDDGVDVAHESGYKLGNAVAYVVIAFVGTTFAISSFLKSTPLKKFINQNLMQTNNGKKL